jgi:hypothetical protein
LIISGLVSGINAQERVRSFLLPPEVFLLFLLLLLLAYSNNIGDGYCDSSLNNVGEIHTCCVHPINTQKLNARNNNLENFYDGGDCCASLCVSNIYGCSANGYDCVNEERESNTTTHPLIFAHVEFFFVATGYTPTPGMTISAFIGELDVLFCCLKFNAFVLSQTNCIMGTTHLNNHDVMF